MNRRNGLFTLDFYGSFFLKNAIPPIYESIDYTHNNKPFYEKPEKNSQEKESLVYYNKLFPKYINPTKISDDYKLKKLEQSKLDGFGINITGTDSIETYLTNNIKPSSRSPIKRKIKRLELCFKIRSEFYFGKNLSKETFNNVIPELKRLLERRFAQRNDRNEALENWDNYVSETYQRIRNKEAMLYVMYANDTVIGISLNFSIKAILIGHIIAYDIDYAKFGLGNTIVYKILEWCIANNYSILDMGNGEMEYKSIWCNAIYQYDYHFVYKKKSLPAYIIAYIQIVKMKFKNFLKVIKFDLVFKTIKNKIQGRKPPVYAVAQQFKLEKIPPDTKVPEKSVKLDFFHADTNHIRKWIVDFVFLSKESLEYIGVYKLSESHFLIKGRNNAGQITLEH
ncbi:GNAT family N-acetyltransferase [Seonamhaeicola sp.]|uniref:GNAT family N-acetyltransferase n=1 Tax=Seonamhaeicola sp. TaxID=1912245 RepID=UPI002605E0BD|nr:GNAT family N-acetyltransferase [Seonamhaeicola sp.]